MKKKELLMLPALNATKQMMDLARADTYKVWKNYIYQQTKGYYWGCYLRSQVTNGILKVAIFLPEYMRMNVRKPAFEVYVDRVNAAFITFDRLGNRWLKAKVDCLPWPKYILGSLGTWISKSSEQTIQRYLDGTRGGYGGLLDYQLELRREALKKKYKRESEPWDLDLAQVPDVPRDWDRWCRKVGIPDNYIFYRYSRKGTTVGYCTYCEQEVPIHAPKHNKQGRCPRCRRPITFKSEGKAGRVITPETYLHLIQRCRDGFVVREYIGTREYDKGNHREERVSVRELRRIIYDRETLNGRVYCWEDYGLQETRWIPANRVRGYSYFRNYWRGSWAGLVYGKTLPSLASAELAQTGLPEAVRLLKQLDPESYLNKLKRTPILEQMAKAGLGGLVKECLMRENYFSAWDDLQMLPGAGLAKSLGIDAQELSRLRQNQGDSVFLHWLRYEKRTGKEIPDCVIQWFCKQDLRPRDLDFIHGKMSPVQIQNYLSRQMREMQVSCNQVITTWSDYLCMASRLKMDVDKEAVYRVRRLRERHDELVMFFNKDARMAIRAGEILEKYPHVEEILQEIKPKYAFSDMEYTVLVPERIEEIMMEGQALSHCVGNVERYWDRMERRESYVLFLRKTAEPDRPYYTLEVEPNGTIRQKRTLGDEQKEDIEDASRFLKKWQASIARRLTQEDLNLAKKSKTLRIQEFEELKKTQVTVRTGRLAGVPLLEVLQQDLMEVA